MIKKITALLKCGLKLRCFILSVYKKLPINQNTILGNFSSVSETYCNKPYKVKQRHIVAHSLPLLAKIDVDLLAVFGQIKGFKKPHRHHRLRHLACL